MVGRDHRRGKGEVSGEVVWECDIKYDCTSQIGDCHVPVVDSRPVMSPARERKVP